jgi:peptidoglycan/xylan/chitin deacetylase (PgdA/CDA1 family)
VGDTLVLCYHAFSRDWPADLSVRPDAIHEQLERLARAGYRGITFTESIQRQARRKEVVVTFDDAFRSVVTHAKPVLDALGWPGTIYTVTSFAEAGTPLRWDGVDHWAGGEHDAELASLDWSALRELRDEGWEIGSHTVTHPHLTQIDEDALDRELTESRAAIEQALDEPCSSIAYPYGDVDPRVIEAAGRAGYATGAALPARWGELGTLEWPRVGVYRPDDMRRFRLKTSRATRRAREVLRR